MWNIGDTIANLGELMEVNSALPSLGDRCEGRERGSNMKTH